MLEVQLEALHSINRTAETAVKYKYSMQAARLDLVFSQ
jgi:hypothetical protein